MIIPFAHAQKGKLLLSGMAGINKTVAGLEGHHMSRTGANVAGELAWRYQPQKSAISLQLGLGSSYSAFKSELNETFTAYIGQFRVALTPLTGFRLGPRWTALAGFSASHTFHISLELQSDIPNGFLSYGYDELHQTYHPTDVQADIVAAITHQPKTIKEIYLFLRLQQAATPFLIHDYRVRSPFSNMYILAFKQSSLPTMLYFGCSVKMNDLTRKVTNQNVDRNAR